MSERKSIVLGEEVGTLIETDVELVPQKNQVPQKTESVAILLSKYFEIYAPTVHKYTQAFVSDGYRGILKTKEEWDIELTGKV